MAMSQRDPDTGPVDQTNAAMPGRDHNIPVGELYAAWCEYIRHLQHSRIKDRELKTVVTKIMIHRDILQFLISNVPSARRVFKQLCLKREVSPLVYTNLMEMGEPDLAFHLVHCLDRLWPSHSALYANPGVSKRSRGLAFRQAVRQRDWKAVMQMVDSKVAGAGTCRRAFLEMVRWGELSLAVELCERGVDLTDGDLDFALRACLRLDRTDCAVEFVKNIGSLDKHRKLLTRVVEQSIQAGRLSCFLKLADERTLDRRRDGRFLKIMFRLALTSQQVDFVLAFCERGDQSFCWPYNSLSLAVDAAIQTKEWKALEKLVNIHGACFTSEHFLLCLKKASKSRKERAVCVSFLDKWCADWTSYKMEDVDSLVVDMGNVDLSDLPEWCFKQGFCNLAFLLSLASGSTVTVNQVVEEFGSAIENFLLVEGILASLRNKTSDATAAILKHVSVNDIDFEVFDAFCDDLGDLIITCRNKGMKKWVVELAMLSGNWDIVKSEMTRCHDRSIIDEVIARAASVEEWDLVQSLMSRCSQTNSVLMEPLGEAIQQGESEYARLLLGRVDPCLARQYCLSRSLLQQAVASFADREEMVRLCIGAGVSTREQSQKTCDGNSLQVPFHRPDSALQRALQSGQLPLVKLLYKSGATSNEELYRLKSDQSLRTRLEGQGRGDIVQYLQEAASSPRGLQDLCRLRVSHLIGCRPGRAQRVESLPLPLLVKNLVNFKDIM